MSTAFVGEVRLVGFNFAPIDWALCNGQSLSIAEYQALFSLIGTTYGGDGQSNFAVPNLQGRLTVHQGSNGANSYIVGQAAGAETVTLTVQNYPNHTHNFMVSSDPGASSNPTNATLAAGVEVYTDKNPNRPMNGAMIGISAGGSQPHGNMQPYLVMNWVIALNGIWPPRG